MRGSLTLEEFSRLTHIDAQLIERDNGGRIGCIRAAGQGDAG